MQTMSKGTALITGASSGIGAIYADRLARRGHDLILVARNRERLAAVASRIRRETGCAVEAFPADLNSAPDRARVEHLLRSEPSLGVLVNNAGVGAPTQLLDSDADRLDRMIDLNVTALLRLTHAVLPAFLERGHGTIINIASVLGIAPELLNGAYGASKAFVIAFSRALQTQYGEKIRIQVVLPGATATEFWEAAGTPIDEVPAEYVMKAEDMVDAAFAGLDRGEGVTIPSLPDVGDWDAYEAARRNLIPKLSLHRPAARYAESL